MIDREAARKVLLEPSLYAADGGELIGQVPANIPSEILSRYHREQNPLKALRARCLDCCCGNASEVRKCVSVDCPSWPFRRRIFDEVQPERLQIEWDRIGVVGEKAITKSGASFLGALLTLERAIDHGRLLHLAPAVFPPERNMRGCSSSERP